MDNATIKNAGIGEVSPGQWYKPAPFAYYSPVPTAVYLLCVLVTHKRLPDLQRKLVESNQEYLEACLKLNPDYAGNCLNNVGYFIGTLEGRHIDHI